MARHRFARAKALALRVLAECMEEESSLFATALLTAAGIMEWMPVDGESIGLVGGALIFTIAANLALGAL